MRALRISLALVLVAAGILLTTIGVNLITGPETSPRVTQSTSAIWGHGNTIVVGYADSSGGAIFSAAVFS